MSGYSEMREMNSDGEARAYDSVQEAWEEYRKEEEKRQKENVRMSPMYKCRICGEKFKKEITIHTKPEAEVYVNEMCQQQHGWALPYALHKCENGNIGIADFLGCVKAGENDG